MIINFSFIMIIYYIFNGDWGLGIGDWGLGIGPNPQSPIPNPHIIFQIKYYLNKKIYYFSKFNNILNTN